MKTPRQKLAKKWSRINFTADPDFSKTATWWTNQVADIILKRADEDCRDWSILDWMLWLTEDEGDDE